MTRYMILTIGILGSSGCSIMNRVDTALAELHVMNEQLSVANQQVKVANEGLELAGNELAQARRRYDAGVAGSLEITDAQTRLERAQDNQTGALYQYNVARVDLAEAMGNVGSVIR